MGAVANKALAQCGLGFFVPIDTCDARVINGEVQRWHRCSSLGLRLWCDYLS